MPSSNYDIGEVLDISQLEKLYADFEKYIQDGSLSSVDLSNIQKIDTAGLQFLIAIERYQKSMGLSVEWVSPTDIVKSSVLMLNLNDSIQLPC